MLSIIKFEGKTEEEALKKCLDNLEKTEDQLILKTNEIEGKLFKAKKFEIEAIIKQDVIKEIKDFIANLSKNMNLEINSEVKEAEGIYNVVLVSENNAILIGKDGKTLNSIQLLIKQTINNGHRLNIKVNVDVSNYKSKKIKNIEYEIKKIAENVLRTKVEVKLDPMNSYERRIVHQVVNEFENLETESIGEDPERYVTIRYKEN